ncbi:hypothetical protein SAMN04490206_5392 [Pseudomonas umsongensis]|jgi:hypothetical protein|nr:hypothetical protein SAMN04490206_5392 [Pseudomonas umsongensis]
MLAMNLRTPRGVRTPGISLTTIASVLAPTGVVDVGYKAFILDIAPSGA